MAPKNFLITFVYCLMVIFVRLLRVLQIYIWPKDVFNCAASSVESGCVPSLFPGDSGRQTSRRSRWQNVSHVIIFNKHKTNGEKIKHN